MKGKTLLLAGAAAVMALASTAPASADEWWESTKISGRMYYDFSNISESYHDGTQVGDPKITGNVSGTGVSGKDLNGTGFDIKRFYVGIDHQFNDMFSANVTTDFLYDSNAGATQLYVKKAYLQAKFDPAFIVRAGSADMPWIPYAEGIYGYRYVENTLIDRTKYGNSADWGIYALGDLADGLVSYEFAVVNGNGYKNPTRGDSIDVEGRISLKYEGFNVGVGGYDGKRGRVHDNASATGDHTTTRFDALAAYVANGIRVGVEYYTESDWNSVNSSNTDKSDGYSVFASYDVTPEWAVFGRYDYQQPKVKNSSGVVTSDVKDNYYNVGVQYSPYKMVNFSLVYKHENAKGGSLSTSDGTIGGIAGAYGSGKGTYDEVGLFGSFQW